jgi:hypothetical protein
MDTMIRALPVDDATIPEALAEGAMALYREVVAGEGRRDDAIPLLAADALFTHAFEAQAEIDPAGIRRFAEKWGARGRLGEIVT